MPENGNGNDDAAMNAMGQSVLDTEQYVKQLKTYIDVIKDDKPKDRVEFAIAVAHCLNGMSISVKGWASWLNHLDQLNQLKLDELEDIHPKVRKIALEFLQIDVEITQKKLDDAKKTVEELKRKKSKQKPYVS